MGSTLVTSDRFQIRRLLGRGGMGEVYEAFDRHREMAVAVKTLRRLDAASIYRFKREFRALADVAHPNLIVLHELLSVDDQWLFTMELIDGVDFLDYVAPAPSAHDSALLPLLTDPRAPLDGTSRDSATGTERSRRTGEPIAAIASPDEQPTVTLPTGVMPASAPPEPADDRPRVGPRVGAFHERRLREALAQLAEGVVALHETGHLHQDIKPSNVLVTRRGRVVLLDFGVVTGMSASAWLDLSGDKGGTPGYMAPERFGPDAAPTAASDWYSVGVMLYIALTGVRPPTSRPGASDASADPRPRAMYPAAPPDLDELCADLLRADPADRPDGHAVLARLRKPTRRRPETKPGRVLGAGVEPARGETAPLLVGRDEPLATLREAFAEVRRGVGATVHVHGGSGMGKSALVARFLGEVDHLVGHSVGHSVGRSDDTVVLAGRCYQRESVPYKAVDSLVDALARYLARRADSGPIAAAEVAAMCPDDAALLARLFPVLLQVGAIARADVPDSEQLDPYEIRTRAFNALLVLIARLAERRAVVLHIDDLQWGDIDSAPLLGGLMHPPTQPPILFIASYRGEDADRSPLLVALRRAAGRWDADAGTRHVSLDPLTADDARQLAAALLGDAADPDAVATIAREAGGHPYFIHELARYAHALTAGDGDGGDPDGPDGDGRLTLDRVLRARIDELPDDARRVLELVALAGVPTDQDVLRRAADLDPETWAVHVNRLHTANLIRHAGTRRGKLLEPFHDRIRETAVDMLRAERRGQHHGRLADSLTASGGADDEALVRHYRGAGQHALAAIHAERAARAAEDALAFDRAAALYQVALLLGDHDPDRAQTLRLQLAQAHRHAGHGADAGEAFLEAAETADPATRRELRTRAAEQLLISGHMTRGLTAIRALLDDAGLPWPRSQRAAVAGLVWRRLVLALRGLGWRDGAAPAGDLALARLDVCEAVRDGLAMVDNIRGAYFQTRSLALALDLGEPVRIGHALGREAVFLASYGRHERAAQLIAQMRAVARARDDDGLADAALVMEGMAKYLAGAFRVASVRLSEAEARIRTRARADTMLVNNAQLFRLFAARRLGAYADTARLEEPCLADAVRRGDRYAEMSMRCAANILWLVRDRPDVARRELEQAVWPSSDAGFHLQHWYSLEARAEVALYDGAVAREYDEFERGMRELSRSKLLRVVLVRVTVAWLQGRLALAQAANRALPAQERDRMRRVAARRIRRIERVGTDYGAVYAALLRAGILAGRDPERSAALLARIAADVEDELPGIAATALYRRGEIIGGDDGAGAIARARDWFASQGVRNIERLIEIVAPGF